MTTESVRKFALSFKEAVEEPHFEKTSFRVRKKIFLTLQEGEKTAVVKLSLVDQSVFCGFDSKAVYPVPGSWGGKGWTIIDVESADDDLVRDAIKTSYKNVAPKKLGDLYADVD